MTVCVGGMSPHPPCTAWAIASSLSKSGVYHVRPELDDMAEVEPMGGKRGTQVMER